MAVLCAVLRDREILALVRCEKTDPADATQIANAPGDDAREEGITV